MGDLNTEGLYIWKDNDCAPLEINNDHKIILVGVPGAFTPTCTNEHLPGFAKNLDRLKDYTVMFFAVNDAMVMDKWNELHGHPDIIPVSDPLAVFSKSINEEIDFGPTFGMRTKRCAYLIENGEIVKKFNDPFADGVILELEHNKA